MDAILLLQLYMGFSKLMLRIKIISIQLVINHFIIYSKKFKQEDYITSKVGKKCSVILNYAFKTDICNSLVFFFQRLH